MSDALSEMTMSDRAAAEWRCLQLIHQFAHFVDAHEYEKLASLFTEDGVFVRPSTPDDVKRGRAAILEAFTGRAQTFTRHLVANIVVTLESPTTASARSYLVLYSAPWEVDAGVVRKALPTQRHGTFQDRFVSIEGQWLFRERIGALTLLS